MIFKPLTFPCIGGTWMLTEDVYRELTEDFPDLDLQACLLDARAWSRSNPLKKNIRRFITNWLIRNRQNGIHLRISRTSMPRFTGSEWAIKDKERMWRRQPHLLKVEIDDLYQLEQAKRAAYRDAGEIENVSDITKRMT